MNQTMKMTLIGSWYTHLLGVLKVSIVLIKHDLFIMYAEYNFWKDSMSTMKPS